jgi:hypothetical protein
MVQEPRDARSKQISKHHANAKESELGAVASPLAVIIISTTR